MSIIFTEMLILYLLQSIQKICAGSEDDLFNSFRIIIDAVYKNAVSWKTTLKFLAPAVGYGEQSLKYSISSKLQWLALSSITKVILKC